MAQQMKRPVSEDPDEQIAQHRLNDVYQQKYKKN